ncbi:rhodanese-like domain-containing protein [Alkalihalophilus sp. As8PL]|uniref:Rhodanese-like domain-containing protein n=1 Tax=Alkalihalophilus sp. As8PL TaxID=3237103 RepID=A0AB39BSW9_9BACI
MKEITPIDVEAALKKGTQRTIIDVRGVAEVAEGIIPGALNIPLDLLEFRMHELDKDKEYIMVCRSGARSGRATQFLESHGYTVVNMVGGMMTWEGQVE